MLRENLLSIKKTEKKSKMNPDNHKKLNLLKRFQTFWRRHVYLPIILGPFLGFLIAFIAIACGMEHPMAKTLGLTVAMMTWWLEGSVRMGLTGLLPIIFLPLMGIADGTSVAQSYFSDSVVVCMGSLIMASAVEKYNLHHRAAKFLLKYARKYGINGILLAFIGTTGFLSMWLSNTATAALMIPLSNAVFDYLADHPEMHPGVTSMDAGAAIDLGIAFAASLGGMATITGTGSNLVLQGTMASLFGTEGEVTFMAWFVIATPLTIINLILLWVVLGCCFLWSLPGAAMCSNIFLGTITNITTATSPGGDTEFTRLSTLDSLHDGGDGDVGQQLEEEEKEIIKEKNISNSNRNTNNNSNGEEDQEEEEIIIFHNKSDMNANHSHSHSHNHSIISAISIESKAITNFDDHEAMGYCEYMVIWTFAAMAILWMTRDPPEDWGWKTLLVNGDDCTDGTVAMAACVFLLVAPNKPPSCCCWWKHNNNSNDSNDNNNEEGSDTQDEEEQRAQEQEQENINVMHQHHHSNNNNTNDTAVHQGHHSNGNHSNHSNIQSKYEPILSWSAVQQLNWDIIFLLGGGFALSLGFQTSGLSEWLADLLIDNGPQNINGFIIMSTIISCFCTNVMSNVAAANVLMSALACVGPLYGEAPLAVLTPVALSISLALLFPIGTPPNAIALANKRVTITTMFKVGSLATMVFLTSILLYSIYVLPYIIDLQHVSSSVMQTCGVDDHQ